MNKWFLLSLCILFFFGLVSATEITGRVVSGDVKSGVGVDPGIVVNDISFRNSPSSTAFMYMTDEELSSIPGMTLDVVSVSKIVFLERIDLASEAVDSYVPLSENVLIGRDFVFVDAEELEALNRSAIIYFYNLSFQYPKILKDGVECLDCSIISYIEGDLAFYVNGFSNYSVVEGGCVIGDVGCGTDGGSEGSSGGGSGGGGGDSGKDSQATGQSDSRSYDFVLSQGIVNVDLSKGGVLNKSIFIENNGTAALDVVVDFEGIDRFVYVKDRVFELIPGEKRELVFEFSFPIGTSPGTRFGKILFRDRSVKKSLDVVLNFNAGNLFDARVFSNDTEIFSCEGLDYYLELDNLAREEVFVNVTYSIISFNREVVWEKVDSFVVVDNTSFDRHVGLPVGLSSGDYLFHVRVDYDKYFAFSSFSFSVNDSSVWNVIYCKRGFVIAVFVLLFLIWFIWRRRKNMIF